eukprot:67158-Rhodomonas_salina.1
MSQPEFNSCECILILDVSTRCGCLCVMLHLLLSDRGCAAARRGPAEVDASLNGGGEHERERLLEEILKQELGGGGRQAARGVGW